MNKVETKVTETQAGGCCGGSSVTAPAAEVEIKTSGCGCGCNDTQGERLATVSEPHDVRAIVREKYGAIAVGASSGCCGASTDAVMTQIGYADDQAATLPEGANLGLGCGNPLAFAAAQPGETVLDLGSGAGIDCFLAAREVGPNGHVIGVDMTPSMIDRARANAQKGGTSNVEFRVGEIEHLPVADNTVDLVISNCVINLSPEKPQVFREALRALKPGGRMVVSDLVLLKPLPEEIKHSVAAYVGCVAGASLKDDYLALMREAGFANVEVVNENRYTVGEDTFALGSPEQRAFEYVTSVKVRAVKPQA